MSAIGNASLRIAFALTLACFSIGLVSSSTSAACCNGAYNRSSARYYADLYWQYPNSSYVYYGDNDCTNFISQTLLYGGVLEKAPTGYVQNPKDWFYNQGIHTNSWSVADTLMRHAYEYLGDRFDRNTTVGTYSSQRLRAGDFIVFDAVGDPLSGPPTHGRIGVGWLWDPNYGQYFYMMNQHSPSRYHVRWDQFWSPSTTSNWKISVHG
jgi:hypothetical protein